MMRMIYKNARLIIAMVFVMLFIAFSGNFKWNKAQRRFSGNWTTERNVTRSQPGAIIFRRNSSGWEQLNGFCSGKVRYAKATLKTRAGSIPIFIHDDIHDAWVSKSIRSKGGWETHLLNLVHHFLSRDESLNLIDIGSHIGEFSLLGATLGRQVIAVDPLYGNVRRLCKSIEMNNFGHLIKVFYTALSDTRTKATFKFSPHNIGGTQIKKMNATITKQNTNVTHGIKVVTAPLLTASDRTVVNTALLNDILPFVSFKKAFVKMDVELHESHVLKGGEDFFKSMDIKYVLMEWISHQKSSEDQIIDFMTRHGYLPFIPQIQKQLFVGNKVIHNILWIKM